MMVQDKEAELKERKSELLLIEVNLLVDQLKKTTHSLEQVIKEERDQRSSD